MPLVSSPRLRGELSGSDREGRPAGSQSNRDTRLHPKAGTAGRHAYGSADPARTHREVSDVAAAGRAGFGVAHYRAVPTSSAGTAEEKVRGNDTRTQAGDAPTARACRLGVPRATPATASAPSAGHALSTVVPLWTIQVLDVKSVPVPQPVRGTEEFTSAFPLWTVPLGR